MRVECCRVKLRVVNLHIFLFLGCLGLLVGCVNPNPQSLLSPTPPPTSGNPLISTPSLSPLTSPAPADSQTPGSNLTPQVTAGVADTPTSTPTAQTLTHYALDAVFDYFQHTLAVTETVNFINNTPVALDDLVLVVEPTRWSGSFSLLSFNWEDGSPVEVYEFTEDQLNVTLPASLAPGESLGFILKYILVLPQIPLASDALRPQPYGYTSRQTNIVDWYPYIPPYRDGEGWLVHPHWWFGENQVYEVADFDVRLSLAAAVENLVIAASAPAQMDGGTYVYHLESARTFVMSTSNEYQVQSINVGGVDVYSYSFPLYKDAGEEVLHNSADALQLFSRLIAPYPRLSLSIVEADFLDGMEYEGLYFLSHGFYDLYDGTPSGYLTFIAAHETAHQWWYGLVGNDQAMEPWLDEAMCTYMEHIFYENIYADYPGGSGLSILNWWWYYRVNYYEPSGYIDRSIYDYNTFRSYRDTVYLNGAIFLHDLRNLIGDEAFFNFLRQYAHAKQHEIATAGDFFTILRQNTDKDLDGLIQQYFQTPR